MVTNIIEYPSIHQFKDVCRSIGKLSKSEGKQLVVDFDGYVKLHGTNFSAVYLPALDKIVYQSRSRILDFTSNFYNFQSLVYGVKDESNNLGIDKILLKNFRQFHESIMKDSLIFDYLIVFGELIGQEVQRGVALEQLSKKFVLFDIGYVIEGHVKFFPIEYLNKFLIYNNEKLDCVLNYKIDTITIDVWNKADLISKRNKLAELTDIVEKECPYAKKFGISGIGEGIVWRNDQYGWKFKVKGDEHANSRVTTLKVVSENKAEKYLKLEIFVQDLCTDNRFKQGLKFIQENEIEEKLQKQKFLEWIVFDTFKEEMESIASSGFDIKNIKTQLYKNAVQFWDFKRET